MTEVLRGRDIQFLLYEFLDAASLLERDRYHEHSVDIFNSTVDAARHIAEKYLLPHYQKGDENEPTFDGQNIQMIPETREAWDVIRASGFLRAGCDMEDGGLQMPDVIVRTAMAYFLAANNASTIYAFLTWGVINLIRSFGSAEQKSRYLPPLLDGDCTGTMVLTEPSQGSSLADIRTRAEPQADGSWRIFGQKMYISGGDHCIADNIIHMVLAKAKGAVAGVHGISLFIVPKFLLNEDGSRGTQNDVVLAGLLHKMGVRNSTSTVLNFGEKDGAIGYLIGGEGNGLACMFQMMNEGRIGVGLIAAAVAMRGYLYSLDYAKQRRQGRLPSNRNPESPQVMLIDHADVRRLLLAQKSYSEGALALCLYATSLREDEHTHPDPIARQRAGRLLGLLTPVVKSWSSRYGCQSHDMAIQVLGGAGYTRDHPVEQLYRDQRLNPIHEGAEAIHGLDMLGRKIRIDGGIALDHFKAEVADAIASALTEPALRDLAEILRSHLTRLLQITQELVAITANNADAGLSNATLYLDVFGRVVVAWIWLRLAIIARRALNPSLTTEERNFYNGKLSAARYYIEWELPAIAHMCNLLQLPNLLPLNLPADYL